MFRQDNNRRHTSIMTHRRCRSQNCLVGNQLTKEAFKNSADTGIEAARRTTASNSW